jgi:hypothetical protein
MFNSAGNDISLLKELAFLSAKRIHKPLTPDRVKDGRLAQSQPRA